MTELITVPTFTFRQGEPEDLEYEFPIQVLFYRDCIELRQNQKYITIKPENLRRLVKEIAKHLPEAEAKLKSK